MEFFSESMYSLDMQWVERFRQWRNIFHLAVEMVKWYSPFPSHKHSQGWFLAEPEAVEGQHHRKAVSVRTPFVQIKYLYFTMSIFDTPEIVPLSVKSCIKKEF